MKLILVIVQHQDAGAVSDALILQDYRVTRIDTYGGFLRRGNATFLVGVEEEQVDSVLRTMREHAAARPVNGDGAATISAGTVFVLGVGEYARM